MTLRISLLAATAATICLAHPAHADVSRDPSIVVTGQRLITPDVEDAKTSIDRTPGGVEIVSSDAFRDTPVQNIKDILGYVPGVIEGTFSGTQPVTWADFFDTKKFPGKRAWPAEYFTGGTMEAALLADGVAPDEIYPIDYERATAKIACWVRRIKGDQFQVFAVNCTHLGCPVRWFAQSKLFMCPCHGGAYYEDGAAAWRYEKTLAPPTP